MAWLVVFFLWITSSNLVLAAPASASDFPAEIVEIQEDGEQSRPDHRAVTFSYKDSNFEQVFLSGTFTEWEDVALHLEGNTWSITLSVPESRQYYNFLVEEGYDSWVAIDPENPNANNHEEYGWVSVLSRGSSDRDTGWKERKKKRRERKSYRKVVINEMKHSSLPVDDVKYQRVDGVLVNVPLSHVADKGSFEPSARAVGNFGFSSGRFGGSLTVLQPIILDHMLDLKIGLFDQTMANNRITGIGNEENSLAGLIFHEDYFDYHRGKGARLSLVFKLGSWLRLQSGLGAEEQTSLWGPSVWSYKKGSFRPNPAIDEGSLNSLFSNLVVGGKYNYFSASYQRSSESTLGGDFDFEKIDATLRGRLNLGDVAGFDVRMVYGSNLQGHLPAQERYLLGGLGTVRGYAYQSLMTNESSQVTSQFGGERMALANLEYFFRLGKCLQLSLFYDAGMVWENESDPMSLNQLKSSTGLGFNIGEHDGLRINMIQRLDDRSHPVVFQLRAERMF